MWPMKKERLSFFRPFQKAWTIFTKLGVLNAVTPMFLKDYATPYVLICTSVYLVACQ